VRGRDAGGRAWQGWGGPAAAAGARGRTWRDGAGWPGYGGGEARAERRWQRARPGVAGCGGGGGAAAETVRLAGLRRNG